LNNPRIGRRKFLKGATATLLPIALGGFPVRAFGRTPLLDTLALHAQMVGRSLVVIQLSGGNDGLNTVIPHGIGTYYTRRPTIGIPQAQVLQLDAVMGLHPSLQPLYAMYQAGKVAVVQGVGYASPNRSHFRSTDIWLTATDSSVTLATGWMGRHLLYRNPGYPGVLTPSPLALQIGGYPSLGLQSANGGMGVTISDPNQFYQLITGTIGFADDPPPNTPAGSELRYLRTVEQEAIQYATVIKNAADRAANRATYPNNSLAAQLKIVARLIAGGLNTPIYLVSQGGYDTHSTQLSRHVTLMNDLAGSIAAFQQDVELLGVANDVIGMTFSEFGRRIAENGSAGTDHGTSSPQFLFGSRVLGGLYGPNPDFTRVDSTGDFIYDIDFRQLYSSILGTWFGATTQELQSVLLRQFPQLPIINGTTGVGGDEQPVTFALRQNYPNPFNPSTTIEYDVAEESQVSLTVFNELGQEVRRLERGVKQRGRHSAAFDASGLASGVYFYRLTAGGFTETKRMMLVR
jgi:uncharacterized protein (DUF1501 family)